MCNGEFDKHGSNAQQNKLHTPLLQFDVNFARILSISPNKVLKKSAKNDANTCLMLGGGWWFGKVCHEVGVFGGSLMVWHSWATLCRETFIHGKLEDN